MMLKVGFLFRWESTVQLVIIIVGTKMVLDYEISYPGRSPIRGL